MLRALVFLFVVAACGGTETDPPISEASCPPGHVTHPSGAGCMPVGPQGCSDMFLDESGSCDPSPDDCPPGTIVKLDEGCIPVGVPGCAPAFLEGDGLCHATPGKCGPGTFPVPTLGCVAIDGDLGCGTDTWGLIEDLPNTLWVDPAASGISPNGSKQAPFVTIADALAVAVSGGRIALAAGNYAEAVVLSMPLELVGRCPSMVTISGVRHAGFLADPISVLATSAPNIVVRGVRIACEGIGLVAASGATVEASGVHIDQTRSFGVAAQFSTLTITRSLISNTRPALTGELGHGLQVESAHVVFAQSALLDNQLASLTAFEPSTTVTVDDSVIARTKPQGRGLGGYGAYATTGASLSFTASAVVENHDVGIVASGEGTRLSVSDSLVAWTTPQQTGLLGYGLYGEYGASMSITGSAVVENHHVGIASLNSPTNVTVQRSLLARTKPEAINLDAGYGAHADRGASLSIEGSTLVDNHTVALAFSGAGTTGAAKNNLIARTQPRVLDLRGGIGVLATLGATVSLEQNVLTENHGFGIGAGFDGSLITARSCSVSRTLPDMDVAHGVGVLATEAAVELESCLVRESRVAAVLVGLGPASATISGSLLHGVAAGSFHTYDEYEQIHETFGGVGDGLVAAFGANTTVTDTLVRDAARAAMLFHESGGVIRGVDASAKRFGIVLQGAPGPDWYHESNRFSGGEQAVLQQGTLPVPEPPPLPSD